MSIENPNAEELRLLSVLVRVCWQYMPSSSHYLDHQFLSAGELAIDTLIDHGLLIRGSGRGGTWTTRAHFLDQHADFSDHDFEAIKAQYLALPEREPFDPAPGYRALEPDVQLCHLRLWFPSRAISKYSQFPKIGRNPGPNRLDVEVRLEPVGAMSTISGELLTIEEIGAFRHRLEKMHRKAVQTAHLISYLGVLEIRLEAAAGDLLSGEITVRNPLYNNILTSEVKDQISRLPNAIAGLDRVLANFPMIEDD